MRRFAENQAAIGEYDEFLILIKKRIKEWFEKVSLSSGLRKTILLGLVNGKRKKKTGEEVGKQ